jgi:hypothetical protein
MAQELPSEATAMWAERQRRIHHYLWHSVRNGWEWFTQSERDAITDLGWEPPRPSLIRLPSGQRQINTQNNSGEDFLYMHRQMIFTTNLKLQQIGDPSYPHVEPWATLPDIGNTDYPVPAPWDTGDPGFNAYLTESKSDSFFNDTMREWESQYRDQSYLQSVSLGELGAQIEFTIHNRMHIRWVNEMQGRPDSDPTNPDSIDPSWDDPAYDWLADTYSSHVNDVFWKLHGWVDDCIDSWADANGITGDIPWIGTWVGRMPPHPEPFSLHGLLSANATRSADLRDPAKHMHDHGDVMGKVLKIVQNSSVRCHFYDAVIIE